MIKKSAIYIGIFGGLSLIVLLLFDFVVMPGYVRMGEGRYMVNVKGKLIQQAQIVLDSEGYKYLISDTLFSAAYNPGTIVDQYPTPNTRVKEGRTVRLKIAHPEKMVSIPDLIGRSIRSAELALSQNGLEIDTVYKEYNSDVPAGNVTWQYPKGGDLLNKGMGLHLTISLGVPPNFHQVPNVFGLSKKKAVIDLEKAGFRLGKIFYRQNEDLIPYTVLNQSIAAETVLEEPTTIDLTVSVLDMQDIFNQMINK
ncbi:MAG: PASTA domain-containing protein [Candidatus Marinimicrobia bacterium]|jgi:serine/threonine-protein kinase|nr:PASTA domain-containing protein [Candidatus Neomarinimicrobiota bacterium]MBT3500919.1 PASTA domain-containing protein [Candidatus Neomarinimicrobiota bacterium]MBT3840086.1 PASTA domain-containing protein [Candidatus Neomarinimicrobiota bacterium]MBT3999945.1 PASTA domain-containing protein [Candidatus Neomarinimicrobiota bacterium]MBT4282995.1 PASTA domain-containing protein [Candidatus Neomarinimicrobiota bacterium]